MKLSSIMTFILFLNGAAMAQSYDRSVVEQNPEPDTSAPSVTVFLDNMRPPWIRIRPAGVTWIDMPYEVRICEASLKFVTADSLKPKDAQDTAVSILSVNVDADKMPEGIRAKLAAGQSVPPINLNCLLAAGQKSKIVVMLELSPDASYLVNLQIKKKITISDLGGAAKKDVTPTEPAEVLASRKARPKSYAVQYYKPIKNMKPSEIHRVLLSGGKKP